MYWNLQITTTKQNIANDYCLNYCLNGLSKNSYKLQDKSGIY